jgi:hypothetical protein
VKQEEVEIFQQNEAPPYYRSIIRDIERFYGHWMRWKPDYLASEFTRFDAP